MAPPKGLIAFAQLELCQPYKRQLQLVIGLSALITVIGILAGNRLLVNRLVYFPRLLPFSSCKHVIQRVIYHFCSTV